MSEVTRRLCGKTVAEVATNGHLLEIRTTDGACLTVAWLGEDGAPLKGRPAVYRHGVRIQAQGLGELIHFPKLMQKGYA